MDLGALLKAPTEDPEWVKKLLLMGVFMLIPVAGILNLLGYTKACYQSRSAGETTLPPAELKYIADGFWIFVAVLPAVAPIFVLYIVMGVGAVVFGDSIMSTLIIAICSLCLMVAGLAIMALQPAILYRHFVHGDRWAALQVREMWELVKVHSSPYIMLWVALFVAGLIGQLGVMACYIGMFFTMPFCYAVQGFALADFANEVKRA
jgi:hypothetical protein